MARRNIGKEIIAGLEEIKAWRDGKVDLKVTTVELPRAVEVSRIRRELGLSQEQFARLMGVSVATLRNWEQGRREPQGAARSLLQVASVEPVAVLRALMPGKGAVASADKALAASEKRRRYRVQRSGGVRGS